MKHLRLFKTEAERSTYKGSSDFIIPNVNYVVESDSVDFNPYVEPKVPQKAGDIVYYVDGSLKTIGYTEWDNSLGTPVGVITIPEGFAPDGKARMVALSGQKQIAWGTNNDTELTNYTKIPTTDNTDSTSAGSSTTGYLPSDRLSGDTSYVDPDTKYNVGSPVLIPSPYLTINNMFIPNPEYYKEIDGNNALSDFNGLANTEVLVGLGTDYTAANACWNYNDGVSDIQWYLPAIGELGYMIARTDAINEGLNKLAAKTLGGIYLYHSSTEYSSDNTYRAYTGLGTITDVSKTSVGYARPWAVVE